MNHSPRENDDYFGEPQEQPEPDPTFEDTVLTLAMDCGFTPTADFDSEDLISFSKSVVRLNASHDQLGVLPLTADGWELVFSVLRNTKLDVPRIRGDVARLRELAASEGTRAVTYLRRARRAEAALRGMVDLADRVDLDWPTFGECKALRNARAALVEEPTSDA